MCLTFLFWGTHVLLSLQGTNKKMSHVTASNVNYHMTQLAPNNSPLNQLIPHIKPIANKTILTTLHFHDVFAKFFTEAPS